MWYNVLMRLFRYSSRAVGGLLTFLLLSVPSALTEEGTAITGIVLQAAQNAISVSWTAPSGVIVDHYTVSYAKQSIMSNNGRFDDQESTIGNETSLVLLDLQNRGFADGDTMYVTVTAVDAGSRMTTVGEEQSIRVQIPGASSGTSSAVSTLPGLEHAIAESATTVKLTFTTEVKLPTENPSTHFAITEEASTNPVGILSAVASGQDVILTTLPMALRGRYTVAFSESVTALDGTPFDQTRRMATFIARGEEGTSSSSSSLTSSVSSSSAPVIDVPPPPDTTPPEPPRNLVLRKVLQENGLYTVHASWVESLNTEGDLLSYNLYESGDRGKTYAIPTALQATVTSTTISDVPPGTLTLKVTALDEVPNESAGIEETIILPETGPALLLGMSALGAAWMSTRKKGKRKSI